MGSDIDNSQEWVAFERGDSFQSATAETKKSYASYSRATSMPTDWMAQPVRADHSITPLPPPSPSLPQLRLPSRRIPTSPKYRLQPVNPSPDRINLRIESPVATGGKAGSSKSTGKQSGTEMDKPDSLSGRSHTCSTSSSSGSDEEREKKNSKPPASPRNPAPVQRGRSARSTSSRTSSFRGRSSSRTRKPSSSSVASARRARSNSRSSRGRSDSRSRPPPTRNNNIRRSRSRSASLTRVTGPSSSATTRSTKTKPPSTSRAREEMRKRGTSSSNSIGPGVTARTLRAPEGDDNIGLDISFGLETNSRPQSLSQNKDKASAKKPGIFEKLFGDQVSKPIPTRAASKYEIRPRILLAATVYHNTATNLWITTINTCQRGVARDPTMANRYLKAFSFSTEREARESAIANAPPKMAPFNETPKCFVCKGLFAVFRRASHCRNCGVCVCNSCSTTWPSKMIPETYNLKKEANVKVCVSCNSLSTSFKKALSQGDYEEAVALYGTGNVNLRTPFPVTNKKEEIMYPIHCAVEGGNIDVIRWLIDDHFCPIKLIRTGASAKKTRGSSDVPILTSKGRSILSIAIERVKVDIMRYLVIECGVSIYESTDLKNSLRALEAALIALPSSIVRATPRSEQPSARWDKAEFDDISEPSSLGVDEAINDDIGTVGSRSRKSTRTKSSRGAEVCIICFDRKINCCATPCGHQMCCLECAKSLSACPVCNTQGDFIKVFRP